MSPAKVKVSLHISRGLCFGDSFEQDFILKSLNATSNMLLDEQKSKLSDRGRLSVGDNSSNLIWEIISNLWDAETNPNGYISLGVAENSLMHKDLEQHLKDNIDVSSRAFTYGDGPTGSKRLRKAIAHFLTKHLRPVISLQPEHILVTNGVSSALEHCSWALANPGDALLLGRPFYGAFHHDLNLRTGTELITVEFGDVDPMSLEAVSMYERTMVAAQARGQNVKGLILCSPHNPLGRCYLKEVLIRYMKFCQKHRINLISDEVYALSVWKNGIDKSPPSIDFVSTLSIDLSSLLDPDLLHVLWGMSKDFGANGLRVGCIISQHNKALMSAILAASGFSYVSSISEHIVANVLEDDDFTEYYIKTNRIRLAEAYKYCVGILIKHKIEYMPGANAAFFLWVNLGKAYMDRHPRIKLNNDGDITPAIMASLLRHKIFLVDGASSGSEKPGWFRIVFSHSRDLVEVGMHRVMAALEDELD